MRRYLIVFLAAFISVLLFFLTRYILQKLTKENSTFIPSLISLSGFIIVILLSFFFLEQNSANPSNEYKPPLIKNGKIIDGKFFD